MSKIIGYEINGRKFLEVIENSDNFYCDENKFTLSRYVAKNIGNPIVEEKIEVKNIEIDTNGYYNRFLISFTKNLDESYSPKIKSAIELAINPIDNVDTKTVTVYSKEDMLDFAVYLICRDREMAEEDLQKWKDFEHRAKTIKQSDIPKTAILKPSEVNPYETSK